MVLNTPESLGSMLNVDVRASHEVINIDRTKKMVQVQPLIPGPTPSPFEVPYDKLLLSTGAAPFIPPIPGANLPYVFTLRDLKDTDAIKARIDDLVNRTKQRGHPGHVVVLGAGFVGLEMVEAFHNRGLQVTVVEMKDHVLPVLDADMVTTLTNDIRSMGVRVILKDRATAIQDTSKEENNEMGTPLALQLASGITLPADLILVATGVRPETSLAVKAGLELDSTFKAIAVNGHLQTSDPDIYAVGDAVSSFNFIDKTRRSWLAMGGPANRQGRLAAEHMVWGNKADTYRGNVGTAIVRCFNTSIGITGASESFLLSLGRSYQTVIATGYSHASYYPGAQPITIKALYDSTTRKLLGAQVYGGTEGVDKRLDVLATAIMTNATIDDLAHLELSYAPPFGAARDVINTLGFEAQNIMNNLIVPERNLGSIPKDRVLIDVRDRTSSSLHPIKAPNGQTVINIPHDEIRNHTKILDKSQSYTTICNLGKLSYFSSRILTQAGIQASSLMGGISINEAPIPDKPLTNTPTPVIPFHNNNTMSEPTVSTNFASYSTSQKSEHENPNNISIDACGLACPGPILALRKALPQIKPGATLTVTASDPGFQNDVKAFASSSNLELVSVNRKNGIITAQLRSPGYTDTTNTVSSPASTSITSNTSVNGSNHDVAIVVFSGEMDKVLAALVIANGAIAMGGKATLFFTFWGLPALRRDHTFPDIEAKGDAALAALASTNPDIQENLTDKKHETTKEKIVHALQKMMGAMLPSGPSHLPLSHMNFGSIGGIMMKEVMNTEHLPNIPGLMRSAIDSGQVRLVACTMSMQALGIPASQLLPGVEYGGVADFLSSASKAHTTLFI